MASNQVADVEDSELDELESETELGEETEPEQPITSAVLESTHRHTTVGDCQCDMGKLLDSGVNIKALSRDEKYRLLTAEPSPSQTAYPFSRPCPSSCLRRFRPDWVKHWPWMHYSQSKDGVYCRACVVFSTYQGGGHRA